MHQAILALSYVVLAIIAISMSGVESGDVNGDTRVTLDDAMLIKNHLLEKVMLEGDELSRADANGDSKVTMADVIYVTTHLYKPEEMTVTLPGDVPLVMVKIPRGSFEMGSLMKGEQPVHTVNIGYDFYVGKYELTQRQWLALMGSWPDSTRNPDTNNYGLGDNFPAYFISWDDCQDFITALNTHVTTTGQGPATFRLLSESEWEYACRAGTQTVFFFGDSPYSNDGPAGTLPGKRSDYMWSSENSPNGANPVGTRLPNQFGLYDMSGNVSEWCQDYRHLHYTGAPTDGSAWESPTSEYRVLRGGGWGTYPWGCESASRSGNSPDYRGPYGTRGMRLSRTQ